MTLQNKIIIVSDAITNEPLVKFLVDNGFKVAGWDLLEGKFWDTPSGLAYLTVVQEYRKDLKLFWCDPTDKDASKLGLQRTEDTLGLPDYIVLPIKEYKKLLNKLEKEQAKKVN